MLLLSVGLCGGFTTFAHQARGVHHSTFSSESLTLLQGSSYMLLILYVAGSIILGIGATALGWVLTR